MIWIGLVVCFNKCLNVLLLTMIFWRSRSIRILPQNCEFIKYLYVKPIFPFDCPSVLHPSIVLCGLGIVKRSNIQFEKKVGKEFSQVVADR